MSNEKDLFVSFVGEGGEQFTSKVRTLEISKKLLEGQRQMSLIVTSGKGTRVIGILADRKEEVSAPFFKALHSCISTLPEDENLIERHVQDHMWETLKEIDYWLLESLVFDGLLTQCNMFGVKVGEVELYPKFLDNKTLANDLGQVMTSVIDIRRRHRKEDMLEKNPHLRPADLVERTITRISVKDNQTDDIKLPNYGGIKITDDSDNKSNLPKMDEF